MSPPDPSARELVAFEGAVQWQRASGAVSLTLHGTARASDTQGAVPVAVMFSGVSGAPLSAALRDARLLERVAAAGDGRTQRLFSIEVAGGHFELTARAVQVHRQAAGAFYAAIPATPVPLSVRWGWSALLLALRVPGAGRLLTKLRGST